MTYRVCPYCEGVGEVNIKCVSALDQLDLYKRAREGDLEHALKLKRKNRELREALNKLIHANRDSIDDYENIDIACEEGMKLLPNYQDDKRLFPEY